MSLAALNLEHIQITSQDSDVHRAVYHQAVFFANGNSLLDTRGTLDVPLICLHLGLSQQHGCRGRADSPARSYLSLLAGSEDIIVGCLARVDRVHDAQYIGGLFVYWLTVDAEDLVTVFNCRHHRGPLRYQLICAVVPSNEAIVDRKCFFGDAAILADFKYGPVCFELDGKLINFVVGHFTASSDDRSF